MTQHTDRLQFEKTDKIELPSGSVVDLFSLNVHVCKTPDDAFELLQTIQEKIIEIEYHLECFDAGCHPNGRPFTPDDPPSKLWLARARKALACSKVQKADAQYRYQKLSQGEKMKRQAVFERCFIQTAREMLDADTFDRLKQAANQMADDGNTGF